MNGQLLAQWEWAKLLLESLLWKNISVHAFKSCLYQHFFFLMSEIYFSCYAYYVFRKYLFYYLTNSQTMNSFTLGHFPRCCVYNSLVDIIKYLLGNAELNKKMDVGWSIPSFNCHWRRHSKLIYHSGKCKRFHLTHTSKDWQSIKLTMSDMFKKIQGQLLQNSYTAMLLIEQFLIWINWKYLFTVFSEKKN